MVIAMRATPLVQVTDEVATISGRSTAGSWGRAVQTMIEHDVSHLVVVDPVADRAVGVVSTLDVAGLLAWGRA